MSCCLLLLLLLGLDLGGAEDEDYPRTGVPLGDAARRREAEIRLGRQCFDIKGATQCSRWAGAGECCRVHSDWSRGGSRCSSTSAGTHLRRHERGRHCGQLRLCQPRQRPARFAVSCDLRR